MRRSPHRAMHKQLGVAWWVVVVVIAVVVAIVGAVAVATSTPSSPPSGTTPSGCVPAGTQCRLFIQNEVSCCNGQQIVGPRTGWCVGWYDALPCR